MHQRRTGLLAVLAVVLACCLAGCTSALAAPGSSPAAHKSAAAAPTSPSPAPPPKPSHFTVVGLGDSVPAGTACHCTDFVHLYAGDIARATGVPTTTDNEAVGGLDSAGLLRQLQPGSPVARAVSGADFITVTIGANDFGPARSDYFAGTCGGPDGLECFRSSLPTMRANLAAALARIHQLVGHRKVAVRVTTYWNVFEDGEVASSTHGDAFVRDSDQLTRIANAVICQVAWHSGDVCVDTYAPFKGSDGRKDPTGLLASDGDHPNAKGHQVIASALAHAGYAPVA